MLKWVHAKKRLEGINMKKVLAVVLLTLSTLNARSNPALGSNGYRESMNNETLEIVYHVPGPAAQGRHGARNTSRNRRGRRRERGGIDLQQLIAALQVAALQTNN